MEYAVSVTNLKKSYNGARVLKGISFDIIAGETFGLLGTNGAGKSTTLECIEGIKTFDSGSIEVFGENILKHPSLHQVLGVQLQSTSLQENITIIEAMKFYCKWQKIGPRLDLLERFGLTSLMNKQYASLSTGQKRRLHLALSIINNPKIVILDEPTAGLDVQGRVELHNEIRLLKKEGITIILASHDMAEVESLCNRIAIIVKGEIRFIGTPDEILTSGNNDRRIKIRTSNNSIYKMASLKESIIDSRSENYTILLSSNLENSLNEILSIIESKNDHIIDLSIEGLSLEDKFVEVVQQYKEGDNNERNSI